MLHFSGWLLVSLAIPAIVAPRNGLSGLWLAVGTVNILFFLVPGSATQRALQASGAFTVLALLVWGAQSLEWLDSCTEASSSRWRYRIA